jgi:DNA-binding NarL/FixJ family response regulator
LAVIVQHSPSPVRVVVVDPFPLALQALGDLARMAGMVVVGKASTVSEAARVTEAGAVDLIIIQPGTDLAAVLSWVRVSKDRAPDIRIWIHSARGPADVFRAAGADGYFAKGTLDLRALHCFPSGWPVDVAEDEPAAVVA